MPGHVVVPQGASALTVADLPGLAGDGTGKKKPARNKLQRKNPPPPPSMYNNTKRSGTASGSTSAESSRPGSSRSLFGRAKGRKSEDSRPRSEGLGLPMAPGLGNTPGHAGTITPPDDAPVRKRERVSLGFGKGHARNRSVITPPQNEDDRNYWSASPGPGTENTPVKRQSGRPKIPVPKGASGYDPANDGNPWQQREKALRKLDPGMEVGPLTIKKSRIKQPTVTSLEVEETIKVVKSSKRNSAADVVLPPVGPFHDGRFGFGSVTPSPNGNGNGNGNGKSKAISDAERKAKPKSPSKLGGKKVKAKRTRANTLREDSSSVSPLSSEESLKSNRSNRFNLQISPKNSPVNNATSEGDPAELEGHQVTSPVEMDSHQVWPKLEHCHALTSNEPIVLTPNGSHGQSPEIGADAEYVPPPEPDFSELQKREQKGSFLGGWKYAMMGRRTRVSLDEPRGHTWSHSRRSSFSAPRSPKETHKSYAEEYREFRAIKDKEKEINMDSIMGAVTRHSQRPESSHSHGTFAARAAKVFRHKRTETAPAPLKISAPIPIEPVPEPFAEIPGEPLEKRVTADSRNDLLRMTTKSRDNLAAHGLDKKQSRDDMLVGTKSEGKLRKETQDIPMRRKSVPKRPSPTRTDSEMEKIPVPTDMKEAEMINLRTAVHRASLVEERLKGGYKSPITMVEKENTKGKAPAPAKDTVSSENQPKPYTTVASNSGSGKISPPVPLKDAKYRSRSRPSSSSAAVASSSTTPNSRSRRNTIDLAPPVMPQARSNNAKARSPLRHEFGPNVPSSSSTHSANTSTDSVNHALTNLRSQGPGAGAAIDSRRSPIAKLFVVCHVCLYWHDLPSVMYRAMVEKGNATRCSVCEHGMMTGCCSGYTCVVYVHQRHH